MKTGLVQCYFGYGKGKTTSAVGQAIRCCGRGYKALFVAFLKTNDSGEFFNKLPFDTKFTYCPDGFYNDFDEITKKKVRESSLSVFMEATSLAQEYDLIVFDEILDALQLGCVDKKAMIDFLADKPQGTEIILTGHSLDDDIAYFCDYITEMKCIRHPFNKGVCFREGIEK